MLVKQMSKEELKQLYSKDYPMWVETNLQLLKEKAYELVDWDNLLEEIEDMGLRHLEACISYLAVILEHMYKLDNFKHLVGGETAGSGWKRSIKNARKDIMLMFDRYPSLNKKLPSEIDYAWKLAVRRLERWLEDNGFEPEEFNIPSNCPYTYEEAMNKQF